MLCEEMAMDHKGRIVGIDISPTVIDEMNTKHSVKQETHPDMLVLRVML